MNAHDTQDGNRDATVPTGTALELSALTQVQAGAIVSRTLAENAAGTLTLFAFGAGQALSEHAAPFDAFVQVLEGELTLTIGGKPVAAEAGRLVVMPANVPHALRAETDAKMLLTMLRPGT